MVETDLCVLFFSLAAFSALQPPNAIRVPLVVPV
jgi:hypothetical protein